MLVKDRFEVTRKILSLLLERLQPKAMVIKESKIVDKLKFDELFGNLQIYEINHYEGKKDNCMALAPKQ